MYLLYLDSSGTPQSTNEEYFILAGIAVFERQVYWLAQEMNRIQQSLFPDRTESIEFHASDISARRIEPWHSMSYPQRQQLLNDVYAVMADAYDPGVVLFGSAVHKASLPPGEHPLHRAFEEVCHRFDLFLKRQYRQNDTQRGLVILDACRVSEQEAYRELWASYRTIGTRWGMLRNMVDVPFFADSRTTRMLQLADFCSYALWRYYEREDMRCLNRILTRFDQASGVIHGLVHYAPDRRSCWCPACTSRRR